MFNGRATTFKPSTQSGKEHYQQSLTDFLKTYWRARLQVEKSEELKDVLQVHAHETTFGNKKHDYCSLNLMISRHLEQKIKYFHFKARIETRTTLANRSSEQRTSTRKRQRKCQEENVCVGSWKASVHLEIRAYSSMNQTRKAPHVHTVVRKVKGKVAYD